MAECLRYILEAAVVGQETGSSQLYHQLERFVVQQILKHNFPAKVYMEVRTIGDVMNNIQVARQNAKSNTVAPLQQGMQYSHVFRQHC